MPQLTEKQLDWTARFTHIQTRPSEEAAPGEVAPGAGSTVQPPATVPATKNPYAGTDWDHVWQQGFDEAFAEPDEPHTAPAPMAEDGQKIFAEGAKAGREGAGQRGSVQDVKAKPEKPPGKLLTKNPKETGTEKTSPEPVDVDKVLKGGWPELTEQGSRTLTAQFVAETGGGKSCFNWNLGNEKATADEPHIYLNHVWEVFSPDDAAGYVARGGGTARIATPEEAKKNGWGCPPDMRVVVFEPPHGMCRFRAYESLEDGAKHWLDRFKKIAAKNPRLVTALNAGDTATAAGILKKEKYYTASEKDYAAALAAAKAELDKKLGPG